MKDVYIEQSLKSHILRDAIREAIQTGEFNPGDRFPSESELVGKYHVSRGTVREAITSLVQEGLLYRVQGKGTFVKSVEQNPINIALMIPHLRIPGRTNGSQGFDITPCLVHAIEDEAKKHKAQILLYLSNNDLDEELANFTNILKHRPDAAIILYTGNYDVANRMEKIREAEIPFVLLDKYVKNADYDYIGTQNLSGAYEAVSQLICMGYRNIYHLTHGYNVTSVIDRKAGYIKAMEEHHLNPEILSITEDGIDLGVTEDTLAYNATKSLLKNIEMPFALFAVNSTALDGAWQAIYEAGIPHNQFSLALVDEPYARMPEDISIVKMIQPVDKIGQRAVQAVIDKYHGNNENIHIEYPADIQVMYTKSQTDCIAAEIY
ncbi:MAG: GntR family transcriptional regulator [Armatimonadota bacterium]